MPITTDFSKFGR